MSFESAAMIVRHVPVSAVVTNYNGIESLKKTLRSLSAASYAFTEIIVVDDGSTDGSCEWIARTYPDVMVVRFERNTANLAKVRNAGIKAASSRYIFLTDNDIIVQDGCVEQLLATMLADMNVISVTPRLLEQDRPEVVYQSGNALHFLGVSTGSRRGQLASALGSGPPCHSVGGGIMLLDKEKAAQLGFFDEGYVHGWCDDGEIHWRGVLAGYLSLHDPAAICLVEVREHGNKRAFGQFHNRLRLILTSYKTSTLVGLSLALLLFEIALAFASLANGSFSAYAKALGATWRKRSDLWCMRRVVQSSRRVPDGQYLRAGAFEFPGLSKLSPLTQRAIGFAQSCTNVFWWISYPFLL